MYEIAQETPLQHAPVLSARLGNRVLLKREDLQPVFSFKIRGAYNKIAQACFAAAPSHCTSRYDSSAAIVAPPAARFTLVGCAV